MTPAIPAEFDVFLSHNSRDKRVVEKIGQWLKDQGLRVWLGKWEVQPGLPWQEGIEEGVRASRAVAVLVGACGLGAWQETEMRAFVARWRRERVPVIPVLLPGCPDSPQLTLFLEAFTWVDLRQGLTEDGLARLVWGITGEKPPGLEKAAARESRPGTFARPARNRRVSWRWAAGILLLAMVLALATWRLWHSPRPPRLVRPEIYAVRVQVLDPQGHPVEGAKVRASVNWTPNFPPLSTLKIPPSLVEPAHQSWQLQVPSGTRVLCWVGGGEG